MDPWAELRKPAREVHYDEHGFPATLLDWRTEPKTTWSTVRYAMSARAQKYFD